ncbi:hypothetical protein M404DRAFT_1000148 [Pisolithus tinctorius Marx 270]|uniref:Uncharacterized protein n=1 Tax=Pisolithus tinctorius Marx 270 TaxID=870435 RepID=A0A0C3J7R1_PISTI|nr:hypothetical protein M404DRAFT_1000148 [Pisolithus tinctorius Marx 270]
MQEPGHRVLSALQPIRSCKTQTFVSVVPASPLALNLDTMKSLIQRQSPRSVNESYTIAFWG